MSESTLPYFARSGVSYAAPRPELAAVGFPFSPAISSEPAFIHVRDTAPSELFGSTLLFNRQLPLQEERAKTLSECGQTGYMDRTNYETSDDSTGVEHIYIDQADDWYPTD